MFYQTKASFKRAIAHAWNIDEAEMYVYINSHIADLQYVRLSSLGEGKDMNNPVDIANIQRKRDRGVSHYNVYEFIFGQESWVVKTEVYKGRAETIYHLKKK